MHLRLDANLQAALSSASQITKRLTESWASSNLYCLACPSPRIAAQRANAMVEDFRCPRCDRRLQLKAKRHRIAKTVANSAYAPKMAAIRANRAPDYAFMAFDPDAWVVDDLFVVPGHFITESVVEKRPPLKPTARRAGWVGSNIRLDRVPMAGRIPVVTAGAVVPPAHARAAFRRTAFLGERPADQRGWVADVLACIDKMELLLGDEFTLGDVYSFEDHLAMLHPANQHVRPKIRQQLQVLRDQGLLAFRERGRYRLL